MSDDRRQGYDIYLSYTGRKTYLTCPKQYEFRYIKKEKGKYDPRNSMFGSIIGKIFEWFYERKFWSTEDPTSACFDNMHDAMNLVFSKENFDPLMDPRYVSSLRDDLHKFIPSTIEVIRSNGFLTTYSRSEVDLTVTYANDKHNLTLKMGGRCDFIHAGNRLNVSILDGKATKHREKYLDSDQLIWYAVQHYLKYHVAPTKLGFLMFRFPENPVIWIDYDADSMRTLVEETCVVANKIRLKIFDAKPSGECHRCDFKDRCDDGIKHLAARRKENGGWIENSIFDFEKF